MPLLGITGVGVAWLGAQTIGAIASLPAFAYTGKPLTLTPTSPDQAGAQSRETLPDRGIALLIEIAKQQSLAGLTVHDGCVLQRDRPASADKRKDLPQ